MPRLDRPEEMDRPEADPQELSRSLDQLAQINGWLGGWWSVREALSPIMNEKGCGSTGILDVGTGGGDIARRVERQWRHCGVQVATLDLHPVTLAYAKRHARRGAQTTFVRGDALSLPFRSQSVDVALCTLTLHHFNEANAVQLLSELKRVAREAVVVSDLRRSWVAWAAIWLLTRLVWRSRIVRHDGPVSVRRAYTLEELKALAARAGLSGAQIWRQPLFRMALVHRQSRDGSE